MLLPETQARIYWVVAADIYLYVSDLQCHNLAQGTDTLNP